MYPDTHTPPAPIKQKHGSRLLERGEGVKAHGVLGPPERLLRDGVGAGGALRQQALQVRGVDHHLGDVVVGLVGLVGW